MSTVKRIAAAGLLGASLLLGGCVYDDAAYGGLSIGAGSPDYYGYGYGGWYDGYYYPGNGYYVFDRAGARYRWNERQRIYWQSHRGDRGGWYGGPRRGNGQYDGRRWQRNGRPDGQVVDRGPPPNRGDGQGRGGNWRGNRDGGPTPGQGQGFRGDRGGGRASPERAAPPPRQMTREPRPSQSTARERRESGTPTRDQ